MGFNCKKFAAMYCAGKAQLDEKKSHELKEDESKKKSNLLNATKMALDEFNQQAAAMINKNEDYMSSVVLLQELKMEVKEIAIPIDLH